MSNNVILTPAGRLHERMAALRQQRWLPVMIATPIFHAVIATFYAILSAGRVGLATHPYLYMAALTVPMLAMVFVAARALDRPTHTGPATVAILMIVLVSLAWVVAFADTMNAVALAPGPAHTDHSWFGNLDC